MPVFQAVRPWSRALSVHQGKGFTPEAAQLGALMEAIESCHGEAFAAPGVLCTYTELPSIERAASISDFASDRADAPGEHEDFHWIQSRRLVDDGPLWVPFDVVSLDLTRTGESRFERGSNGLGAHFNWPAAAVTAILELIERDALRTWLHQGLVARSLSQIDQASIPFDWFRCFSERVSAGHADLGVYILPTVIPTPAYLCEIIDPGEAGAAAKVYGAACHPDAESALSKAALEAIQTRLTFIAGARDDILYRAPASGGAMGFGVPLPSGLHGQTWPGDRLQRAIAPEESPVGLAQGLARSGFTQTAIVDLTAPDDEVVVVKAVSPGLGAFGRTRRAMAGDVWAAFP